MGGEYLLRYHRFQQERGTAAAAGPQETPQASGKTPEYHPFDI